MSDQKSDAQAKEKKPARVSKWTKRILGFLAVTLPLAARDALINFISSSPNILYFIAFCIIFVFGLETHNLVQRIKHGDPWFGHGQPSEPLENRARVIVSDIMNEPFTPEAGKLYRVIVTIQNIGKTPAKNLKTTFVIEPAEKDGAPNFDYTNDQKAIVGLLSPGVNHKLTLRPVNSRSTGEERPLTQELADAITSGRTRIFVHGRVDYEDIFGQPHWISFCAHTLFPMADNFGIWPTHNETDE